jgi:hypothetical protein
MSFDLAGALQAALDDGCSLAELEASLLAGADTDDQLAAAWLFAWANDAIRPRPDDLAARITTRSARDRARERCMMLDAAIDRSVIRGELTALPARPRHGSRIPACAATTRPRQPRTDDRPS